MKLGKSLCAFLLLSLSTPVLSQSIEIMHLSEGDSVDLNGFVISAKLDGLDAFDDGIFYAEVQVYQENPLYPLILAETRFRYNHDYRGENPKLMEPDVYFLSGEPCPAKMHLVAKTGNLGRIYISEPVGPGDEVIIHVQIWGYIEDAWEYFETDVPVILAE